MNQQMIDAAKSYRQAEAVIEQLSLDNYCCFEAAVGPLEDLSFEDALELKKLVGPGIVRFRLTQVINQKM